MADPKVSAPIVTPSINRFMRTKYSRFHKVANAQWRLRYPANLKATLNAAPMFTLESTMLSYPLPTRRFCRESSS